MLLDTSVLAAIAFGEPGAERLVQTILASADRVLGAPSAAELAVVLGRRGVPEPEGLVARLCEELGVVVLPFPVHLWREAAVAWRRFGKGRHPAALNLGDCYVYAVARATELPLFALGDDFAQTDLHVLRP